MRLNSKAGLLGLVSLFLALSCLAWTYLVPARPKIEGYVYYANGKPMENVKVWAVYSDGTTSAPDLTNKLGHYSVQFTTSDKPIWVTYVPQQQIYLPELENLSGSISHTISRTEEVGKTARSASRVREVSKSAMRASTLNVSPADKNALQEYYVGLLSDVRVEEATVKDQAMLFSLQQEFTEARRQYGLPEEYLKNEAGQPLKLAYLQDWPNRMRAGTDSCMTRDVLKELLRRVCQEEPPSISGLTPSEVQDLRQKLGCQKRPWQLFRDDRIQKSKPSPDPVEPPVQRKP